MTKIPKPIIRSTERVRDLGEVLTPPHIVKDILAQIPQAYMDGSSYSTVLEPSCGDGNFLVEILESKILGISGKSFNFKSLEQLSSIYGVDISPENIFGSFGHKGARDRIAETFVSICTSLGHVPNAQSLVIANWIIQKNIQLADMLTGFYVEKPRTELEFIKYEFNEKTPKVKATVFTQSEIKTIAGDSLSREQKLFAPAGEILFEGTLGQFFEFCEAN